MRASRTAKRTSTGRRSRFSGSIALETGTRAPIGRTNSRENLGGLSSSGWKTVPSSPKLLHANDMVRAAVKESRLGIQAQDIELIAPSLLSAMAQKKSGCIECRLNFGIDLAGKTVKIDFIDGKITGISLIY